MTSPYWLSDCYASRKSNLTDKRTAGFRPTKKVAIDNEGLSVKLIYMTKLEDFAKPLAYMVNATVGGAPAAEEVQKTADEIFEGGLQHALENILLVFEVAGCSRAFTHQVVRHRNWRFHQQSFRWSGMNDDTIGLRISHNIVDKGLAPDVIAHWEKTKQLYKKLEDADIPFQDCRDILPIGTQTYIIAEVSLKHFIETFSYRGCSYFQPQMVYVMWQMRARILEQYPMLEKYIKLSCEKQQKCTYQGWENCSGVCRLPWADKRNFTSSLYK